MTPSLSDELSQKFDKELEKVGHKKIGNLGNYAELQTGDILFFTGNYIFSRGTQFLSESIWNHMSVVVDMNDLFEHDLFTGKAKRDATSDFILNNPSNLFMVESVIPNGVRLLNFSKAFRYENGEPYRGRIAVTRLMGNKPANYKIKFRDFLFSTLGERYGNSELLGLAAGAFMESRYNKLLKNERNPTPPYVCTELVYYLTKYTYEIDLVKDDETITPKNLYANSNIELIGELML